MVPVSSFVVLLAVAVSVRAQFPRVCAFNASRADAVCCPPSPLFPSGPVCGGRGECRRIPSMNPSQRTRVPRHVRLDDRLDWPQNFFSFACKCSGNFWGYACHRCKPGWIGPDCDTKGINRVRKNANSLSRDEQEVFRRVMSRAKTQLSDWVVLNVTSHDNGDPIFLVNPPLSFYNVSVYNFLIFLHFYSARSTLLRDTTSTCPPDQQVIDVAHKGPGFPSWHRFFLIEAEYELEEIRRCMFGDATEHFAMPYWDWVDGTNCSVCTNGLVGALNETDPQLRLDSGSSFYPWRVFCGNNFGPTDCHTCDPTKQYEFLWRAYNTNPAYSTLPRQAEIDHLMTLTHLDLPPYSVNSNASSFRNNLEGFVNASNRPNSGADYLHNMVHMYMRGSNNDVAVSPNEPLFFLHHSFVDKIFDTWLRKTKADANSLPAYAQPGHARDDPVVPAFPRMLQKDFFKVSYEMGFLYDNDYLGNRNYLLDQ